MCTVNHITDYLYLNNSLNINDITIDNNYVPKNYLLHEIDNSLTKNEIYFFELLNNFMEDTINKEANILLNKYYVFSIITDEVFLINSIDTLLDKIIYINSNIDYKREIITNISDKFLAHSIHNKYKLIIIYLCACNIFKYSTPIRRLTINNIICIFKKFYNDTVINDIIHNIKSFIILEADEFTTSNYNIYINSYHNYNKLITNTLFLYNQKYDNISKLSYSNLRYHFIINNKLILYDLLKYENLVDFIGDEIQKANKYNYVYIPNGLVAYLSYFISKTSYDENSLYEIANNEYIELIIKVIIDKQQPYINPYDPYIFLTALFDAILSLLNLENVNYYVLNNLDYFLSQFANFKKYNYDNASFSKRCFNKLISGPEKIVQYMHSGFQYMHYINFIKVVNKLYNKYFNDINYISITDLLKKIWLMIYYYILMIIH